MRRGCLGSQAHGSISISLALDIGHVGPNDSRLRRIEDIIRSISDGAACTTNEDCLGSACLTEADGFPGGYCTT
jgi:hypothetical protein